MLQHYLLFWLTFTSGLAFFWPQLFPGGFDPFLPSGTALTVAIFLVMFAVGSLLRLEEIREVGRRWPAVLFGTTVQYVSMPLLAWSIGHLFGFQGPLLLGVIMVGCVPGAMASNVMTLTSRGNVSYSVALTTLATMLSPIAVPLALWLTLDVSAGLDLRAVSLQLLLEVVLPVILGFGLRRWSSMFSRLADVWAATVANVIVLWIIAAVVALNRERLGSVLSLRDGTMAIGEFRLLIALLLINVLGYLSGYLAGHAAGLPDSMRRALAIEIGMQNCGLGTKLILTLFQGSSNASAAIPTALYTFLCVFTAAILAAWWSRRPAADEPASAAAAN